jgi:hypothetical protein
MIRKWYEVSCSLCDCVINIYADLKPTPTDLRKDGIKVIIKNGKILTFCEECYNNKIKKKKSQTD